MESLGAWVLFLRKSNIVLRGSIDGLFTMRIEGTTIYLPVAFL